MEKLGFFLNGISEPKNHNSIENQKIILVIENLDQKIKNDIQNTNSKSSDLIFHFFIKFISFKFFHQILKFNLQFLNQIFNSNKQLRKIKIKFLIY